ncbi:MAG: DUF1254 domain-containing protein [Devosia sp.]
MIRTFLYAIAGLLLGLAIHLVVVLTLPMLADRTVFAEISALDAVNTTRLLSKPAPGAANTLKLDPDLSYAVCRLNLANGPGELSGTLPAAYWSVAVYDQTGAVLYSTTNRDGIGQTLDLGIFDPAQTRLLAEQKIDIASGLLIVEAHSDDVFVVVRLAPPHPSMRDRYEAQLQRLSCGNIQT